MIVKSCTFSVYYPKNNKVREQLFNIEHGLDGFQKPFTLVPLPEGAPEELPRIIAISKSLHSRLVFSGINAQIETNFDENYNHDIDKCLEYMNKKSKEIIKSISIINGDNNMSQLLFSGLTVNISYGNEDINGKDNPSQYIYGNFLKCRTSLPLSEAQFKLVFTVENRFYINLMLQNVHEVSVENTLNPAANLQNDKESLLLTLDVNDRYAHNYQSGYYSSVKTIDDIFRISRKLSFEYADDFIRKGELNYDNK